MVILNVAVLRIIYQMLIALSLGNALFAEPLPTAFKAPPTRPANEANIILEDQEVLEACDTDQICVEGLLFNNGSRPAYQVKLRIEIGGMKQGKPRHVMTRKVANSTMLPGDRQDLYLTIDRKIQTKDKKGKEKIIEVGKYNFKIIPVWSTTKPKKKGSP